MPNNTGAEMRPRSAPQQRAGGSPQDASKRSGTHEARTWPSNATEYRDRFLPPSCYQNSIPTLKPNPKQQPNGSSPLTTSQSLCVAHTWTKKPTPKAPSPFVAPQDGRRYKSAPHDSVHFGIYKMEYTTVYQSDFKSWNTNRQQPFKQKDSLTVRHGLIVTEMSSGEQKKSPVPLSGSISMQRQPGPIESVTSYRADFIPHEVMSRPRRVKAPYRKMDARRPQTANPSRLAVAVDGNQELPDGNKLLKEFKTWSLESSPQPDYPANPSTPAGEKSILPSIQTSGENHQVSQTTTNTKDCDCEAPHRLKARPVVGHQTICKRSRLLPRMHSGCNTPIEFSGIKCSSRNVKTRTC